MLPKEEGQLNLPPHLGLIFIQCGLHYRKGHFCNYCMELHSRTELLHGGWTTCTNCNCMFHLECAKKEQLSYNHGVASASATSVRSVIELRIQQLCMVCVNNSRTGHFTTTRSSPKLVSYPQYPPETLNNKSHIPQPVEPPFVNSWFSSNSTRIRPLPVSNVASPKLFLSTADTNNDNAKSSSNSAIR